MDFDKIAKIPKGNFARHANIVVDCRHQKKDPNRVRITAGGNLIRYPFELTTRTADLTTSKILWNSTISAKGAKYACADAKIFCLLAELDNPECMSIVANLATQDFIDTCNLKDKIKNGYTHIGIMSCICGLPQSTNHSKRDWNKTTTVKLITPQAYSSTNGDQFGLHW